VPVTISGSHRVLPKGAWRLRPGIVDVYVSEPIAMTERRPGALRNLADQVQRIIEKKLAPNGGGANEPGSPGARQYSVRALVVFSSWFFVST
jgi:1-acyl-sn-glycerol-3-phosphate acyltransferase